MSTHNIGFGGEIYKKKYYIDTPCIWTNAHGENSFLLKSTSR